MSRQCRKGKVAWNTYRLELDMWVCLQLAPHNNFGAIMELSTPPNRTIFDPNHARHKFILNHFWQVKSLSCFSFLQVSSEILRKKVMKDHFHSHSYRHINSVIINNDCANRKWMMEKKFYLCWAEQLYFRLMFWWNLFHFKTIYFKHYISWKSFDWIFGVEITDISNLSRIRVASSWYKTATSSTSLRHNCQSENL